MTIYAIIADNVLDQITETKKQANQDLQAMGCSVKIVPCETWEEADALEERLRA